MSTRCTPLAGVTLLGVLIAGCGSSSGENGAFNPSGRPAADVATSAAPDAAVPPTLTKQQIDQIVLDRYREYQKAYKAAYERNDASDLSTVAMDPLLTIVTKDVEATAAKGEIWRFTNVSNPQIQGRSKDNQTIIVLDCLRTLSAYRYSAKTGKLIAERQGGAFAYQAIMQYTRDSWKISEAKWGKKC